MRSRMHCAYHRIAADTAFQFSFHSATNAGAPRPMIIPTFAIPPDSPLVDDAPSSDERFAWSHAVIVLGMHVAAVVALFFVSRTALLCALIAHVTILYGGAVIGYHRLLSHQVFRAPAWLIAVFATLGTLTFQGGPILWAATHRVHHRQTDRSGDAHAASRGFWWSHMGWTFYQRPNGFNYAANLSVVRDLLSKPYLRWLDRNATALNIGLMIVVAVATRRADVVLWIFPARIVAGWHSTWLINSYAHFAPMLGRKRDGQIRNSWLVTGLMFGEGWHANHHRFPGRANTGLRPHEVDPAYWVLRALDVVRLIRLRRDHSSGEDAT